MYSKFICLTLLLFTFACCRVHADTGPAACAVIDDETARLACYDGYFRPGNAAPGGPAAAEDGGAQSPIGARVSEEAYLQSKWFSITPHKPNYFIPVSYNGSADYSIYGPFEERFSDAELKFQVSLKTQIWPRLWRNSSLWAAYTQQSYWQLYADSEASAPFRETNHEPELIWQLPVDFRLLGFDARVLSLSLNHQSNGRIDPISRSWNRLKGSLALEKGRFVAYAESWIRVDDPEDDDNPDIEDFMGRVLIGGAYKGDRHTFAVGLKNNLDFDDNRSGVEFNWTFPLASHLKGYVQLYSGYGENLIDMENYNNRIGFGIALTDWL